VALILDGGPCAVGIESTILDLSGTQARILRPGMLDAEAIAGVLGAPPIVGGTQDAPRVSGSLEAHYAPQTPLRLVEVKTLGEFAQRLHSTPESRSRCSRPARTPLRTNA
jgi:L-threonylcarbamoyladenylate synthase